jgi:gluconolactonase
VRAALDAPHIVVDRAPHSTRQSAMDPTRLASGLHFPEGPVWLGHGRVAFTEIRGQRISLWEHDHVTTIADTGGGPNGATLGPDGALYVANNGGLSLDHGGHWLAPDAVDGRIQRISLNGEVTDVATALPGEAPHRPNDLCFGPDGLLYFTDPHDWEHIPNVGTGRVNRTTLDGRVELLAEVPWFPNGIAFGPDGRLYVAQSMTQKILVMDPRPGAEPADFATLPGGYPDGFCFDVTGALWVCGSLGDCICIFEPDGKLRETIATGNGTEPTNCCLADGELYVTVSGVGELWCYPVGVEPFPLRDGRLAS